MKKLSIFFLIVLFVTGISSHAYRATIAFWKKTSTTCNIATDAWGTINLTKTWTGPLVADSTGDTVFAIGKIGTSTNSQIFKFNENLGLGIWSAVAPGRDWRALAASSDTVKLVAVVYGGQIYTSTDSGITWTARDSNRNWVSVASSSDGTKLVAAESGGQLYTSTNSGATWTARDSARDWSGVATSSNGTKLVAAVSSGQIYTSTDSGVTWIARDSARNWVSVASSSDGTKLVAAVNGGRLYTSTDSGAAWTQRDSNRSWTSVSSSSDGSRLIATLTDSTSVYTSKNSGSTWTARSSGSYKVANGSYGLSDGSGILVMAQDYGDMDNYEIGGVGWLEYGTDFTWVGVMGEAGGDYEYGYMNPIAANTSGSTLIVESKGRIFISTDSGASWIAPILDSDRAWGTVTTSADGTKFAALSFNVDGDDYKVYVSTDSGVTWTERSPTTGFFFGLAYSADGSKLYVVQPYIFPTLAGGKIHVSSNNGSSWSANSTGRYYTGVAPSSNGVKALASEQSTDLLDPNFDGRLYTSTNTGGSWTVRAATKTWMYTASSADGVTLGALGIDVSDDSIMQLWISVNSGSTWTQKGVSSNWGALSISSAGTTMVALDADTVSGDDIPDVYISTNSGTSWTKKTTTVPWTESLSVGGGWTLLASDASKIMVYNSLTNTIFTTQCN